MRRAVAILAAFGALVLTACSSVAETAMPETTEWRLVIHGGAGVILRGNMTPEREAAFEAALQRSMEAGAGVLRDGGEAIDAVQAAVLVMEDDPLFNAGYGAVFTQGCNARRLLDAGVDTQVQGGGLGGAHDAPAGEVKNLAL